MKKQQGNNSQRRRRRVLVVALFDKKVRRLLCGLLLSLLALSLVSILVRKVRKAPSIANEILLTQPTTSTTKTSSLFSNHDSKAIIPAAKSAIESTSQGQDPKDCKVIAPGCIIYAKDISDEHVQKLIMTTKELTKEVDSVLLPVLRGKQRTAEQYYVSSDYATLTKISNRREVMVNQDRGFIIVPFHTTDRNRPAPQHQHDFIIGTFDGHGDLGHTVAQYAVQQIGPMLATKLEQLGVIEEEAYDDDDEEDSIVQSIKDVFMEIEENLAPQNAASGGCTGSIVLRWGLHLYVANAGDSRSFVATYDTHTKQVEIPLLTRLDKPNLPEERSRIEKAGGHIFVPNPPKDPTLWSRVIITSKQKNENVGLAMSRSIGDSEWSAVGVISEPIVNKVTINEFLSANTRRMFVVSASDGLFDMRQPEFIAHYFAQSLYEPSSSNAKPLPPLVACHNLLQLVTQDDPTRYRDDITVSVMKVPLQ
jgi:serine/threonine protein phosphatase PrpC